jgi:glycerol-3-phosphate dehydrogenase
LFLDARLAASLAQDVGKILLDETGINPEIEAFTALTQHYLQLPV